MLVFEYAPTTARNRVQMECVYISLQHWLLPETLPITFPTSALRSIIARYQFYKSRFGVVNKLDDRPIYPSILKLEKSEKIETNIFFWPRHLPIRKKAISKIVKYPPSPVAKE